MKRLGRFLIALAVLAVLSAAVAAQDKPAAVISPEQLAKIRAGNDECFACHSTAGITHPPKPDLDLKRLRGLVRDADAFYGSDHQRLACTKCHNEGYDEHPHAAESKESTSTCTDCHSKKSQSDRKTVRAIRTCQARRHDQLPDLPQPAPHAPGRQTR